MRPSPRPSHALRAASVVVLLLVAAFPALGDPEPEGHWEDLGEDGRIWVPARPPLTPAYLPPADLGAYHNASETVAALTAWATARPDLLALHSLGTSVQGRPLLMATLTGPGDATGRVRVLFDGAHHGDEVIASETLTRFLAGVVAGYDANATMRALLAQVVLDVVPMMNPDGVARVPTCTHYADCRKNARGVDLNRNYPDHWGGPGSSSSPSDATYRGPAPLSEPESRALNAILDTRDYALHATLHSGTELILYAPGWTTAVGPEDGVYKALGDELTSLTGVANGQSSKILYLASGTTQDQMAGSAAGWRALSFTPEIYKGAGNAFDWWYLFNPPESALDGVVAKWTRMLWHLVAQAPNYRPTGITAPEALAVGPDGATLFADVAPPARRPLLGASLLFEPAGAPVRVDGANPISLADGSTTRTVGFPLAAERGGAHPATLRLLAVPAGAVTRPVALALQQVGLDVAVALPSMGSPETNSVTVALDAGPFERVAGIVEVRLQPSGRLVASEPFDVTPGVPFTLAASFSGAGLPRGANTAVATASFTTTLAGETKPGAATASAGFLVERPEVRLDKRFKAEGKVGEAVPVTSIYRNTGTMIARDVVVRETVPAGYTYTTRDGPVPLPPDPLGRPAPDAVEPRADGGVDLVWRFGDMAPGAQKAAQYRIVPLAAGQTALLSTWTFTGSFLTVTASYVEEARPVHTAQVP